MERRSAFFAAVALAAFASPPAEAHGKKYFLTVDTFPANQAVDACGKGYHMASLWEIFDPTELRYDAKRGQTRSDSGSGPPAGEIGWIRTGSSSNAIGGPGSGNCNTWSSFLAMDFGSTAELSIDWDGAGVDASPWTTSTSSCVAALPVWCKQN